MEPEAGEQRSHWSRRVPATRFAYGLTMRDSRQLLRAVERTTYICRVLGCPKSSSRRPISAGRSTGLSMALVVVPSHVCREVYSQIAPSVSSECLIVSATKGLETSSGMRMEEVAHEVLGRYIEPRYVVLSGPTFALEVARDEPSAIVAGARDAGWAAAVQDALSSGRFRVYTNSDVVGVEVAGAVKNVMAIATGAVAGLGLGYNSAAALVTRGLAEISPGSPSGLAAGLRRLQGSPGSGILF